MRKILTFGLIGITFSTFATTWFAGDVIDPISGKQTKVQIAGSYGGYIYKWSSKYDGIYWPLTDPNYLRFNPESGYIAFGSDFEDLDTNLVEAVSSYLKSNYDTNSVPKTHIEKLQWAEKVYTVRGADEKFYIRHYCLLSYLTRSDEQISKEYRQQALEKIEAYLKKADPSFYRSQLYVVAGFYSKLLGNGERAEQFWSSTERLRFDKETTDESKKYLEDILNSIRSGKYKGNYYGDLFRPVAKKWNEIDITPFKQSKYDILVNISEFGHISLWAPMSTKNRKLESIVLEGIDFHPGNYVPLAFAIRENQATTSFSLPETLLNRCDIAIYYSNTDNKHDVIIYKVNLKSYFNHSHRMKEASEQTVESLRNSLNR